MTKRLKTLLAALGLVVAALMAVGPAKVAKSADVALSSVISGGLYNATTTSGGFATTTQVDRLAGAPLQVKWVLTGTLPAYTKTGSAGSEVLTANANGALGAQYTSDVACATNDPLLIAYNPTSNPDSGLFTATSCGSGGTPWVLTRTSAFGKNTAAVLGSSLVSVTQGRYAGQLFYQNTAAGSITVGTTPLMWEWTTPPTTGEHGFTAQEECTGATGYMASSTATTAPGTFNVSGWQFNASGTAAEIKCSGTNNGATIFGEIVYTPGTSTTGTVQSFVSAVPISTRNVITYDVKFQVPQLSNGTDTYSAVLGFAPTVASDTLRLTLPSSGAMQVTSAAASVAGTPIALGTNIAINTSYRMVMRKPFNQTTVDVYWDDGTGTGLQYKGTSSALAATMGAGVSVISSAGTGAGRFLRVDWQRIKVYDPLAHGA